MHRKAAFFIAILLPLLIAGCGGPKYSKGFTEWLGLQLATTKPVKLDSVSIEELSSGKTASAFNYHANVTVTEDLYKVVTPPDRSRSEEALNKLRQARS